MGVASLAKLPRVTNIFKAGSYQLVQFNETIKLLTAKTDHIIEIHIMYFI